jgi:hypothetical protein
MGGIRDEHAEWAVVNRLKAMLDDPPETKFNVTQTFAIFSSILLWTKNRAWVSNIGVDLADKAAQQVRAKLKATNIFDPPWSLSKIPPRFKSPQANKAFEFARAPINADFAAMTSEDFFKWLRNALAHGDGRTIKPLHKPSQVENQTWLAGFEITFVEKKHSKKTLALKLFHDDMRRIGVILADAFCRELSGDQKYFEIEAGTQSIKEAA